MSNEIDDIDKRRESIANVTSAKHKSHYGQYMTPSIIANFMVKMFRPLNKKQLRLLDAGAGIGSLTAAFIVRAKKENATSIECEAWEVDQTLHKPLRETLDACEQMFRSTDKKIKTAVIADDFVLSFSDIFTSERMTPTHAILNPPYKKISSSSAYRLALRANGIETGNLYSAFVALSLLSLSAGGELVAITPRSFCNGPYFKPFRELILSSAAIIQVHVFKSRTHAFKGDDVLQENVIFHIVKGEKQGNVLISSCFDSTFTDITFKKTPFTEVVLPGDHDKIFNLATEEIETCVSNAISKYQSTLDDLGISVSTGQVVDFRMKDNLRESQESGCVPLIYSHHFENGFIVHPKIGAKKPNYIVSNELTNKWLMPKGYYLLVRRLSSKEEKRRIIPAIVTPENTNTNLIGFDNKTNLFHYAKKGLPVKLIKGLVIYLSSTFADQWLRRFSGHTQVNATDLRALRYPDRETLKFWGEKVNKKIPTQYEIDQIVGGIDV